MQNETVKKSLSWAILIIVVLLIFGAGYWLRSYLYDNSGTVQRMETALGEANANNKRIAAENDELRRLNTKLTEENNRSKQLAAELAKYGQELAGQLGEIRNYVARIEQDNRANEIGLAESAEINRRIGVLIGEVEKTAK